MDKCVKIRAFFLWIRHLICDLVSINHRPPSINGRLIKEANASLQFFISIIITTALIVTKSGIRVVTLSERTSFSELTSPMIRASIFPVGLLSKAKAKALNMGV